MFNEILYYIFSIIAGIVVMERILTALGKNEVTVSDYDNLEGSLFEYML